MRLPVDFKKLSPVELLQLQSAAVEELRDRNIVRTSNNPIGDYTEWLVAEALNLTLESNSKAGYDAVSKDRRRIQIKGRRYTRYNNSRQLSAIRKLDSADFDDLIAVIYDEDFNLDGAYRVPHHVVKRYAVYRSHSNAHILLMQGPVLADPEVVELTEVLLSVHSPVSIPGGPGQIQNGPEASAKPEPSAEYERLCPACEQHIFTRWPSGWDAHAAHRCSGLQETDPERRKAEYKARYMA